MPQEVGVNLITWAFLVGLFVGLGWTLGCCTMGAVCRKILG